jgi:hypothetical protein
MTEPDLPANLNTLCANDQLVATPDSTRQIQDELRHPELEGASVRGRVARLGALNLRGHEPARIFCRRKWRSWVSLDRVQHRVRQHDVGDHQCSVALGKSQSP